MDHSLDLSGEGRDDHVDELVGDMTSGPGRPSGSPIAGAVEGHAERARA